MGTFGRDTLAVCFLNILSYCPRPPFFELGSMGATSLGYPTFFALKLFGNRFGAKNPTAHVLFSGIPFYNRMAGTQFANR